MEPHPPSGKRRVSRKKKAANVTVVKKKENQEGKDQSGEGIQFLHVIRDWM
jgi:hypothetical protein